MPKYSTNKLAEKIVGKRIISTGTIIFDAPFELGYHCPKCKYETETNGEYDERLDWSEYNGFIWCRTCNVDYPSAICQPDMDKAIEIYLGCVIDAKTVSKINWKKLREDFYWNCTDHRPNFKAVHKVNIAPHNLFEWFKGEVNRYLKE